eukprot:1797373-Amphidinium_carterae.1
MPALNSGEGTLVLAEPQCRRLGKGHGSNTKVGSYTRYSFWKASHTSVAQHPVAFKTYATWETSQRKRACGVVDTPGAPEY